MNEHLNEQHVRYISSLNNIEDTFLVTYYIPQLFAWRLEVLTDIGDLLCLCGLIEEMGRHFKVKYRGMIFDSEDKNSPSFLNLFSNTLTGRKTDEPDGG